MSINPITTTILTLVIGCGVPLCAADDHAGHDHGAHAHGHDAATAIGKVDVGAYKVAVSASGGIAAGKEWHVELVLTPDQPVPKALRIWVGVENGRGSVKAKAAVEPGTKSEYGAHVEVPSPLPADAKLWVSIEVEGGQASKGSLALPAAEAGHHEGDGHKH